MTRIRSLALLALVASTAALPACGGDGEPASSKAPPGSPENPLVATVPADQAASTAGRSNEGASAGGSDSGQPGYRALLEQQTSKPRGRFTPCNLVTRAQASKILGEEVQDLLEAPQGPTCIYRSKAAKSFVTVAVQSADFDEQIEPRLHQASSFSVGSRTAYCGQQGQQMLYVPLSGDRVLAVAAPCKVAKQFAAQALRQLPA